MGLADELAVEAEARPKFGPRCPIARIHYDLSPDDQRDLVSALSERDRFTARQIARVLNDRGFVIGESAIQRHRRGVCMCP